IYTVDDIIKKGYSPIALRLFYISGNYRQQQNFTIEALTNTQKTLEGIYSFIERLVEIKNKEKNADTNEFKKKIRQLKKEFFKALDDDISAPEALAKMHAIISRTNSRSKLNRVEAKSVIKAMLEIDEVLGLKLNEHAEKKKPLDKDIQSLVDEREKARKEKNFKRSDEIRALLKEKYRVILEDTSTGVTWRHF
ncbi:MAG: DALR domain-containing protein, partial [Candidatus Micrarchaeales archaeon]